MLQSHTIISCCQILKLKLFFSTLFNFKRKMMITGTLTITGSFSLYFEKIFQGNVESKTTFM